jgi:hypothetical protein
VTPEHSDYRSDGELKGTPLLMVAIRGMPSKIDKRRSKEWMLGMTIPSLKEFIDAMSISWPIALAISIGSGIILVSNEYIHISYVQRLPEWFFTALFIIFIFSLSILIVSIIQTTFRGINILHKNRKHWANLAKHVSQISELPDEEMQILMWAAKHKRKSFVESLHHPQLEPLIAKGFIRVVPGQHSIIDWPYIIPDHIWDAICLIAERVPDEFPDYPFNRRF